MALKAAHNKHSVIDRALAWSSVAQKMILMGRVRSHDLSIEVSVRCNFHACVWSEFLKWIV